MSRELGSRWSLPNSWVWTKLSALGDIIGGGTPSTKEPTYWTDEINWISPSDLTGHSAKTIKRGTKSISKNGLTNSSAKVMPAGSVHFSTRAPIGYIVISSEPLATNQGFKSLVPAPGIFNAYVYYYLIASRDYARKRASGTTFLELSGKAFGDLAIPLAPAAMQHKIVTKIEELFSELDKGIESLKAARAKLNIYRQAVLKHAFEGKLTAQWREENKDKLETPEQLLARIKRERVARYEQQLQEWNAAVKTWEEIGKPGKKPAKPKKLKKLQPFDIEELAKLPNIESASWKWVKVDEICSQTQYSIKAGPFGSSLKKQYYVPDGYKIYGQEQVISGDPYYGDYYIDSAKYEELETCKISPKDVLISLVGTVGKVLVLPDDCREGIINPRLIKITLNLDYYRPVFFKYFFESAFVKTLYKTLAKGTTMDVLNLGIIQNLPFPLCSLAEQDKLVAEIESKLSVIDQIERETEAALKKSEALRKSILKNAFSGKMVTQNPGDEPASLLLERIRAEKTEPPRK